MSNTRLATIRSSVEKELIHYEIFDALHKSGLLKNIVFQGGTSLRLCRGSDRFSEDLDFAGGVDFCSDDLLEIKKIITEQISSKFGLSVTVKEPKKKNTSKNVNVSKWTINIQTDPKHSNIPFQKIKIEIANIPAYTKELAPIKNNYPSIGRSRQIYVYAESMEEIMADKIIAFPTSVISMENGSYIKTPSRVRYRDIWDLSWLSGKGINPNMDLIKNKINDYGISNYIDLIKYTQKEIPDLVNNPQFKEQMSRFVGPTEFNNLFGLEGFEVYIQNTLSTLFNYVIINLESINNSLSIK